MKSAIKKLNPVNGAGSGQERQHKLRRHKKVEASAEKEEGKTNVVEFAAAANLERGETDVERKVIQTYGILEVRELEFEPGIEFGQAVIELRNELKKNGRRDWMKRLEELDISYAKARYWMAIVEGKPINRGRKEGVSKGDDSAGVPEKRDWHEDWPAAVDRFRQTFNVIITLFEEVQAKERESFIGELQNFAAMLGYEVIAKEGGDGLLQRLRPESGDVAEGTRSEGADRKGGSR